MRTPSILENRPSQRCEHFFALIVAAVFLILPNSTRAADVPASSTLPDSPSGAAILQDVKNFRELGSVLFIAAHPDDENTQLLTYLALGRHYRTAYLSATRGDGGQNLLGPEFGEELGVIRTQELLSARRLDGAHQFFTRAIDFGFSKDAQETLKVWDRQETLGDMVRIIREFRPDVLITRFSTVPGGTHGHHTASAILGLEAFKQAGDSKAFPEQLTTLTPWQPKRIFMNQGASGRGGAPAGAGNSVVRIDINGNDEVSGQSFADIAARSRAMHKTQGFGNAGAGGGRGGARLESFTLLDGEPATKDILDGVDTTWTRFPGGADLQPLIDDLLSKFDPKNPAASVPAILILRPKLAALPADPVVIEKQKALDHLLQECLGLVVQTTVPQAEVVPRETINLHHEAIVRSNIPVKWLASNVPSGGRDRSKLPNAPIDLQPNQMAARDWQDEIAPAAAISQPYWLREQGKPGMFRVDDASLIGRPENPPAFPIEEVFEVAGQTLVIPDEPVQLTGKAGIQSHRRLDIIPPVSIHFAAEVRLFAPASTRPVEIELTAYRANTTGSLKLDLPAGWTVAPASQSFTLAAVGDKAKFTFNVTAPSQLTTADIGAHVEVGGASFGYERIEINYEHVPFLLLQPPAKFKAVSLEMATRGKRVAYIAGAGDSVAAAISEMGYSVTEISGADLTPEKLKDFDAVVIGIRAFNVRNDLVANLPALFAYAEAGGTVIEQYNRPDGLQNVKVAPFDLRISQNRVTDETAKMTFLVPDHPVLNTPNKITDADFDGWVQERGIYFPSDWDKNFTPILACNDAGESPMSGGLLIAHHGKGYFVYTGLVWFRQLPAGVPGAYRLFANLLSLGK